MNKAVKIGMIGVGITATLFVVALIVFVSTFDINDYKGRIVKAVKDETGRTLAFKEDLALSFFPGIEIQLGGVALSNAKGFGNEPMVEATHAAISVRIIPLLTGNIKFGFLELDGLRLNLSRKKDGTANWDDLVGRAPQAEAEPDDSGDKQFSLEIGGIQIHKANLFWDDAKSNTQFILNDIKLETGQVYEGAPFPISTSLDFKCARPDITGSISLSGKSSIDFSNREYGHMDMKVSLNAEGKAIPGGKAQADLGVQFVALDFNKEHAQITGLVLNSYGATLRLDGSVEGITNGIKKIVATVTADPFNAKNTLTAMGIDAPNTTDNTALTNVGGMAEVIYSPQNLQLKSLELNLDGTRIVGSGQHKVTAGEPYYLARLDVGSLDLDRYLSPDHAEHTQKSKDKVAAGKKDTRVFDTRGLRRLHMDLEANIAKLRIESVWAENVKAALKAKNGTIRISPLSANLYGGSLSSGMTINATGKYPTIDIIAGLDKINIGALSKDVNNDESYKGLLDFNGAVSCQGERVPTMLRSMNGKIGFHLANGVFPGVNIKSMTTKTHESKQKGGEVIAAKTDSTSFGSIQGTGTIKAGILKNKDLEIKAPGLRADGHGSIVLPTQQIDYLLKAKLVATSEGQGGKASDDLYGVMVPIRVAGTLENPRYWVSVTEYVKALGGAVIGTAGSIVGGAFGIIKGVGKVVTGNCCDDEEESTEKKPERKKFLGIF